MYAVVVVSIMFGAVIVMVKKAAKEMTIMRMSGSSIRVKPNLDPRKGKVTYGHFSRLKLSNASNSCRISWDSSCVAMRRRCA
jgi:hypothetical protein